MIWEMSSLLNGGDAEPALLRFLFLLFLIIFVVLFLIYFLISNIYIFCIDFSWRDFLGVRRRSQPAIDK